MTTDVPAPPCDLCGSSSIVVVVNGFGFCFDHVDEGYRRTTRLLAVTRGVPVEVVERALVEAMDDLASRYERDHE